MIEFLKTLLTNIQRLFNTSKVLDDNQIRELSKFSKEYMQTQKLNLTALVAQKVSSHIMVDSSIKIQEDNQRAISMNKLITSLWRRKMRKLVSRILGVGGLFAIPRVSGNKLYIDWVDQSLAIINKADGDEILAATFLAETKIVNKIKYYRWLYYSVENGTAVIEHQTTTQDGIPTQTDIFGELENLYISNVTRPLFAFFRSSIDNRDITDLYGVPITYGTDETMNHIIKTLYDIDEEYENKKAKIFADEAFINKDKNGKRKVDNTLFTLLKGTGGINNKPLMQEFSPEIREAYFTKLNTHFKMLEKEIGVNEGILTEIETSNATATEIKKKQLDTYTTISDMRSSIEDSMQDLIYSCDVLSNYFNLTPISEYSLSIDWSYLLIENSEETFKQLQDGEAIGAVSTVEVRNFIFPNETKEDAEKAVEEIKKSRQTINTIV